MRSQFPDPCTGNQRSPESTSGWVGPAIYAAIMCLIAAVSAWTAKETGNTSIDDWTTRPRQTLADHPTTHIN